MESISDPTSTVFFSPHRMPLSQRVVTLIASLLPGVESALNEARPRLRARTARARKLFELQVSVVLSDALYIHTKTPGRWLKIGLSDKLLENRSRYKSPAVTGSLRNVLYAVERAGLIELRTGTKGYFSNNTGTLTTFRASGLLIALAGKLDLTPLDFGVMDSQEVIVLKGAKPSSKLEGGAKCRGPAWIDYPDNDYADECRSWLRSFNDHLARADLALCDDVETETAISISDRRLKRVFNDGSFSAGGRLFGGCWQQMKKQERKRLRIDGMRAVCLDYGQMGLRILYAEAGVKVPTDNDPYDIPGLPFKRAAIKKFFGAMVNMKSRPKGFPEGLDSSFPGVSAWSVAKAIECHHQLIAHLFYSQGPLGVSTIGMEMMHRESQILIGALNTLMHLGVAALPIHDALLVAEGEEEQAKQAMLDSFLQVTGHVGAVSIERL